jgi:hypothetical protein
VLIDMAIFGLFYFVFCRFFLAGEMQDRTTGFIVAIAAAFVAPIKLPVSESLPIVGVIGFQVLFAFIRFLILLAGTRFFIKTANKYHTAAEPVGWPVAAKIAGSTVAAAFLANLALIPVLQSFSQ